jgi:two-component system chemotaxis response regulator CheB
MGRHVVVVGASAGGVEALRAVVGGLPPGLPAPVVVVLHIAKGSPSALPRILNRAGPLSAVAAEHGAPLRDGVVYAAPSDHHVLIADGHLRLSSGPTENGHRPAIDPLFRSAAVTYGPCAIGVVLSGTRDDGSAGLAAIAQRGGGAVVQESGDALYPAMPANALEHVPSALVQPAAKIGGLLGELVGAVVATAMTSDPDDLLAVETEIAAVGVPSTDLLPQAGPSPYSCPSCHGVLFEIPSSPAPRFRCRVGHAWSLGSHVEEQGLAVEEALWAAVRALEERAALLERLADRAARNGHVHTAATHTSRAVVARQQADHVRALLDGGPDR